MEETREGLDITIGSQQIGLAISQAVVQRLGGRYSTHPKLIGEKAGKKLFRVTYSVRLPRYIRGDVVRVGRGYGQIMQVEGQYIRFFDLSNGQARSAKEEDFGLLIGNVRDAAEALIAYVDGDVLGLIDPGSGVTRECPVGPWRNTLPGQHIRVLKDQEMMIPVG
jgi:nonsense-mediated mRNA decay protein 3